jgi:H+/Cl- antiporter ClcA
MFLPLALPICVWIIRTFAADARGHGTEAVIAAVHQRAGRVDWLVAPVKLSGTTPCVRRRFSAQDPGNLDHAGNRR